MSSAVAVGSDDDTLSDDRKRELVTGRALWLIGDNLQHCPGQRFLGQKWSNLLWKNEGCSKTGEIVKQYTWRITPVSHYMMEIITYCTWNLVKAIFDHPTFLTHKPKYTVTELVVLQQRQQPLLYLKHSLRYQD